MDVGVLYRPSPSLRSAPFWSKAKRRATHSQPARRLRDGSEQCAALVHRLFPFGARIGVVDDAAAGLHVQATVLDHRRADRDRSVGIAPPADVADRAGVDVALV